MTYISSDTIRQKFLDFMQSKWHAIIPSAPVVPENDPTVLFNTAGMQPLVPYLLGQKHPSGKRLADSQKCIRTNDIDEVGDNSHLTFFEMLGNWSLGDYFKKDSIAYSWEFLTGKNNLALDPKMIAVTVFEWDDDAPRDEASANIWKQVWVPEDRISYLPKSENWWAAGDTGPCGPDTEIFYWVGESEFPPEGSNVGNDEDNWMEIWNNVFMEFNRISANTLINLPAQNVDTGMWLERITTVINGETSVYHTDIFQAVIDTICSTLGVQYNLETQSAIRIIADHTRTTVVMMSDGVLPSNVDQGYILRRLMRRAIRKAHSLWHSTSFMQEVAISVIEKLGKTYPNITENKQVILLAIEAEEKQFLVTLEKGLKEFEKLLYWFHIALEKTWKIIDTISWEKAFRLYDTYGFPIEMTEELAKEKWLSVDVDGFNQAFIKHQEKSRTASAGKFKGGLADDSQATTELHTATHLLLAGLRKILGNHVFQKGSNITPERLRFDFSHEEKMTPEELQKVEDFVNSAIQKWFQVEIKEIPKQQAIDEGVVWSFWEKYPDIVKVYSIKNDTETYSIELCGGPHVADSKNMGRFQIQKEEASSRGVRRIKAVLIKD